MMGTLPVTYSTYSGDLLPCLQLTHVATHDQMGVWTAHSKQVKASVLSTGTGVMTPALLLLSDHLFVVTEHPALHTQSALVPSMGQ